MKEYDSKNIQPVKVNTGGVIMPDWENILSESNVTNDIPLKVILFVNYYRDNDDERQYELDYCLLKNLNNNNISYIYLIVDDKNIVGDKLLNNKKIRCIVHQDRPTFNYLFTLANKKIKSDNYITIITNTDVYFDDSIKLTKNLGRSICCALTRYDLNYEDKPIYRNRVDSQDSWIFRGRIKDNIDANFTMGKRGCDNRLAYELEKSGYAVINPSMSIITYHLHKTEKRNYSNNNIDDLIPKPYKFLQGTYMENRNIYLDKINALRHRVDNKKVVFHIGLNLKNQSCLVKALELTFGRYISLDWKVYNEEYGIVRLRNKILDTIIVYKPEIIFMQIQTPNIIDKKFINFINKIVPDCKIINWTGDVRMPIPKWFFDVGKSDYVYTCFTNQDNVNELRKKKINAHYLQIGYEHTIYTRNGSVRNRMPKIVFMGNNYRDRFPNSKLRASMVDELYNKYGNDFCVYGNGWGNKYSNKNNYMDMPHKEAEVYRSCLIAIGASHYDLAKYSSDRMYRAMGSGAFYLTKYYKNIEDEFNIGVDLDVWNDINELIEKIDYYLSNPSKIKAIADSGNKKVELEHRWQNRMSNLKEIVGW